MKNLETKMEIDSSLMTSHNDFEIRVTSYGGFEILMTSPAVEVGSERFS